MRKIVSRIKTGFQFRNFDFRSEIPAQQNNFTQLFTVLCYLIVSLTIFVIEATTADAAFNPTTTQSGRIRLGCELGIETFRLPHIQ